MISILNQVFNSHFETSDITLPIGLSFFTFQILSYMIDVYKREAEVQKRVETLALYILLFPQLIAGPIVRYSDIKEQLWKREITLDSFYSGSKRFMIGFSKKILIADIIGQVADLVFDNKIMGSMAWIGMIAYTLQIYYDFSGYSDMAIGMGRMFGFNFNENFQYPYFSFSVKEFWRRWHISLSEWFRDYLYIPLGGSRCREIRSCFNLTAVFFCTGLWHGANWNFIFWGLYYAAVLIMERIFIKIRNVKLPKIIAWIYTSLIVMTGWVFFRSNTMGEAVEYIRNLFVFKEGEWKSVIYYMDGEKLSALLWGMLFSFPVYPYIKHKLSGKKSIFLDLGICFIFMMAVFYMAGNSYSPFLYFRF